MNIRLILVFLGMLAVGHAAQDPEAERLTFETKTVELTLEPGDQTADIKFPFSNNSDKTVEFDSLQAACSCMNAGLKGGVMAYKPETEGEVTARFNVGTSAEPLKSNCGCALRAIRIPSRPWS